MKCQTLFSEIEKETVPMFCLIFCAKIKKKNIPKYHLLIILTKNYKGLGWGKRVRTLVLHLRVV